MRAGQPDLKGVDGKQREEAVSDVQSSSSDSMRPPPQARPQVPDDSKPTLQDAKCLGGKHQRPAFLLIKIFSKTFSSLDVM